MSERQDAFHELRASDRVHRGRLEGHASPRAQRMLRVILDTPREEPPPSTRRRLVVVIAIAVIALVALAATWLVTRPVTHPQSIVCYQAADLESDRVAVASGPTLTASGCEAVWAEGTLSNPEFGPAGSVPPLVGCVGGSGALAVFPSDDPSVCARLGLAIPDPASIPGAETVIVLNNALVDYFSARHCIAIPEAVAGVRTILDAHGASDWTIETTPGPEDRPCASYGLDAEAQTVFVVPIPEPTP
jgi:hypothetical protein